MIQLLRRTRNSDDLQQTESTMNQSRAETATKFQIPSSHTGEGIREWREHIETFFDSDWKKVSEIMFSLEESLWDAEGGDRHGPEAPEGTSPLTRSPAKVSTQKKGMEIPSSNDPEQNRRLESLAMKIEERLRATSGNGTK